ncbi:MAG TPA: M50 family metallopeptidase [Candidatus Paceibacterota bacterium]|nr:M50 family metallopeptidase [Candidatus Paceibacterota bacterium]
MGILIFILVLVALIVVHEFGHFVAAKIFGMRVDEFGLGYPPRALTIATKGETKYTLNWIPFGGFVKIYGENSDAVSTEHTGRAFTDKNRLAQAIVLVAGVAMNLVFAYVLITAALITGTPRALAPEEIMHAKNPELAVADVLPGSPAARAGLVPGDIILGAEDGHFTFSGADPTEFTHFVSTSNGNATIMLSVRRGNGEIDSVTARPEAGIVGDDPSRYALGLSVATIGVVSLSFGQAIIEGAQLTWGATIATAQGLLHFFAGVFTFTADLSQVSGPVGIAGAVGSASAQGIGDLLSLMAVISINLALINLIPIPALDGGRLLFVIIESIIRRPIRPTIVQAVNGVSFALLILLMIVVTFHDLYKIVG